MFVWSKLSAARWEDAWEERFAGHGGFVLSCIPGSRTIRVEVYCSRRREALAIQRRFGGAVRAVRRCNWAASQPALPSLRVRDSLLVVGDADRRKLAVLARAHPGRAIVCIPADMAFGTGHHPTTATVLRLLADYARSRDGSPWSFCDLGAGSGVLAVAASKLGAARVWGCDHDLHAVRVARRNVRFNRAQGVRIERVDVLRWKTRARFDCIAGNLFSDVLEAVFPRIVRASKPGATLVISGLLKAHSRECLRAARRAGIATRRVITNGKWVTAIGTVGS